MKIAIASEGKFVSAHFGHCEGFEVFEIENNQVIGRSFIQNPGHKPGFLPPFLAEHGINTIIAGGMGGTAQMLFNENNISVIVGAEGNTDHIIEKLLKGELVSTESVCSEHAHEGHCND